MTTLDCAAVVRQLWDYLDGELTPGRMEAMALHLSLCARCAGHEAFERSFQQALQRARTAAPDTEALASRIRAALAEEGFRDPR